MESLFRAIKYRTDRTRTCSIITRGLYIYNTIFEEHFFVVNEVFFKKNLFLCMIID
jgi:hypothetical protein